MVQAISFIKAGYCMQIEKLVNPKSGKWRKIPFPSSVAVIEHKTEGVLLFDTGYTPRMKDITRHFPERLYALVTPITVEKEDTAIYQLNQRGISEKDVKHVVLSHFHADHVAGVLDYPSAKLVFSKKEYREMMSHPSLLQLRHAFLPALLPHGMESRNQAYGIKTPLSALGKDWTGYDYFDDGSLFVVPLPGHSVGHLGLYLPDVKGKEYFLIGDAAWLRSSFLENVVPAAFAQHLVFSDPAEYAKTLGKLHQLRSDIAIVPCHCHETLKGLETHV